MSYYSEKEIDFSTEYINYNQFLLQEFFNSDAETWGEICRYYRSVHGNRSLSYLARKFNEWKNGDYHLTDLMESRILETMPRFLTKQAKEKLSLNDFLSLIKRSIKSFERKQKSRKYNFSDLTDIISIIEMFREEVREINGLIVQQTRFGLLTDDEKTEAKQIVKYILKIKLQTVYSQLRNDLNVILPFIGRVTRGKVSISYKLRGLNANFNFRNSKIVSVQFPKFEIKAIHSKSRFDAFANKYLAYEMLEIHKKSLETKSDGLINEVDLKIFFGQYEEFTYGENEVKMDSIFRGEAGELAINASIVPIKLLKLSIYKSIYKILITVLVLAGIIGWLANDNNLILLAALWFITIPTVIIVYSFLKEEISSIIRHKNEIENYG